MREYRTVNQDAYQETLEIDGQTFDLPFTNAFCVILFGKDEHGKWHYLERKFRGVEPEEQAEIAAKMIEDWKVFEERSAAERITEAEEANKARKLEKLRTKQAARKARKAQARAA